MANVACFTLASCISVWDSDDNVRGTQRGRRKKPTLDRSPTARRPMLIHLCRAHAAPSCAVPWPWEVAFKTAWSEHGSGAAWVWRGMCESNTAALCIKWERHNLKPWRRGMAGERHGQGMFVWIKLKRVPTKRFYEGIRLSVALYYVTKFRFSHAICYRRGISTCVTCGCCWVSCIVAVSNIRPRSYPVACIILYIPDTQRRHSFTGPATSRRSDSTVCISSLNLTENLLCFSLTVQSGNAVYWYNYTEHLRADLFVKNVAVFKGLINSHRFML
jgi:hypothetical protein